MIGVDLNSRVAAAGELLSGTLRWKAARTERAREFRVWIEWQTKGIGNDVYCTAREAKWKGSARDVEREIPFRLLVPFEGPVSYSGTILNIEWKLFASADVVGGADESVEIDFEVGPRLAGALPALAGR